MAVSAASLRAKAAAKGTERHPVSGGEETTNKPSRAGGLIDRSNKPGSASGYMVASNDRQAPAGGITRSNVPQPEPPEGGDNERSNPRQGASDARSTVKAAAMKPNPEPRTGVERIAARAQDLMEAKPAYAGENIQEGDSWAKARVSAARKMAKR